MGLDWKPMNKPKPGREKEYDYIFSVLNGKVNEKKSFFEKLFGNEKKNRDALLDRFLDMSIPAYETLSAPQVGIDAAATNWARQQFEFRKNKNVGLNEFVESMNGYFVVELVPVHDGIPVYIAPHYEPHIFRAKFLDYCREITGDKISEMAYSSQLAEGTLSFGHQIMKIAENFAASNNVMYLKYQRTAPDFDENSAETKAHIMFSAAKWLLWWGERGHGYEADF